MMADSGHSHVCPECGAEWPHEDPACDFLSESCCEECLSYEIYWVEEISGPEGAEILTIGFVRPEDPNRELTEPERQLMRLGGFQNASEMDEYYANRAADARRETSASPRGFDAPEGEDSPATRKPRHQSDPPKLRPLPIEFSVQRKEFGKALRFLIGGKGQSKQAQFDFIDLNAKHAELEIVTTGASSTVPAEVAKPGYSRVPFRVIERIRRSIRSFSDDTLRIGIEPGSLRVEGLRVSHPEITVQLVGARIADLPSDAPLLDIVALLERFRPEELEDSGILGRVMVAQEKISDLIDKAAVILGPLGVTREQVSQLVRHQIKKRGQPHKKTGPPSQPDESIE